MKKFVFTKTFENKHEMESFANTNVGDDKFYKIRKHWINVDGLTMTITMTYSKYFWHRQVCLEAEGFVMEKKVA